MIWVWCGVGSYNKWTYRLRVYRRLLTNCLHGKELNYVWLTAEITVNSSLHPQYVLVKFYCDDVITRSHLQLINTSISTFFNKLRVFLVQQRRRRKASDG